MQIQHNQFATSASLRSALKRGLARQALASATRDAADIPKLVRIAAGMRPNPKAIRRLAHQLSALKGIAQVAIRDTDLVVFARNPCDIRTEVERQEIFSERALVYTRLAISCARGRTAFDLTRASFCLHALERLVERGTASLNAPLLPVVDAEAVHLLRALTRGRDFTESNDHFVPALGNGVWAGSLDRAGLEDDWGLVTTGAAGIPLFSARTYLGEEQMRPTLWWAWNNALRC